MIEYLSKKYEELVSSVLDPIFEKIKNSSWSQRFIAVCLIGTILYGVKNEEETKDFVGSIGRLIKVVLAEKGSLPISRIALERGENARNRLLLVNKNDINLLNTGQITGWSAAQTLAAISIEKNFGDEFKMLIEFIRKKKLTPCGCWPEYNDEKEEKAWIFISGWILSSLADANFSATKDELDFLLAKQNANGSWNSASNSKDPRFSSPYATAWAIIGLVKQKRFIAKGDDAYAKRMQNAIDRAVAWLINARQTQTKGRWKAYPNIETSNVSGSISGVVMHALHLGAKMDLSELDQEWLSNLPDTAIPVSVSENNNVEIQIDDYIQTDHFEQLVMPWMTIATLDAYDNGKIMQKTYAIKWMERNLMHDSVKNADAAHNNWWRAELAVALNYLYARTHGR